MRPFHQKSKVETNGHMFKKYGAVVVTGNKTESCHRSLNRTEEVTLQGSCGLPFIMIMLGTPLYHIT